MRLIHVVNELVVIAAYETTVYSPELLTALREGGAKMLAAAGQEASAAGVATSTAVGSGRRSARIYRANILKMLLKIMDGYVKLTAVKP